MEYGAPDNLGGQKRQPRPLPIPFGGTLRHPTQERSAPPPMVPRGTPSWGPAENLFHTPTRRHSLHKPLSLCCRNHCHLHRGRTRTNLLDSMSSHKYLCDQERYLFSFSLSSLLPSATTCSPVPFAQILMTSVNCTLCIRNLVRDLSMVCPSTRARESPFY